MDWMRCFVKPILLAGLIGLTACSTINHSQAPALRAHAAWSVVPFDNQTPTPLAGERAKAIAEALLSSRGVDRLHLYQSIKKAKNLPGMRTPITTRQLLRWARRTRTDYVLTGDVTEWRYKVGIDGEPAVGVTLKLWDVQRGKIIWSAVASRTGNSRQAVSYIAQQVMDNSLNHLLGQRLA